MKKMGLSIKSWWLSLFGKKEFEENSTLVTVEKINELEAPRESEVILINGDSNEIEAIDALQEIKIIQMNEDSSKTVAPKGIEITQTNENHHSKGSLNTEVVYPLYDGKYDGLFSTPKIPIPLSVVDQDLWDRIQKKLPENYIIPCPTSHYLYNTHSSKRI